jgi:hypothetical protein
MCWNFDTETYQFQEEKERNLVLFQFESAIQQSAPRDRPKLSQTWIRQAASETVAIVDEDLVAL